MSRDCASWPVRLATASLAVVVGLSLRTAITHAQQPLPPSKLQYPLVAEFKTPPPAGTVTPGSACEVAREYARLIAAKRPATSVPELFAEDGLFLYQGKLRRGRKEIHEFYDNADAGAGAIPVAFFDHGAECIMEVAIQAYGVNQPWRLAVLDHFTITPDRKIARLVIYQHVLGSGAPPRPQTGERGQAR